ncbi:MAG TPA: hypothetical protein PLE04_04705, partial [Syntrophales bacterium]|nr:hypothetical protein [Syntrophales bacterium]
DFAFAYLNGFEKAVYLWRSPDRPLTVIDARGLNLGRWFCSTPEIFKDAWSILRGALGDLRKLSKFEAVPYRLYRVADDGEFEVEPVRELRHTSRLAWSEGVESIFDSETPGGARLHHGSRHSKGNQRDLFGDGDSDVFQGRINCRPKGEIEL